VRYVTELLDRTGAEPAGEAALNGQVATQLLDNQERIVQSLLDAPIPVTRLNGYSVPAGLADFVNCWGNSREDEEKNLDLVYYRCQTNDDIYLAGSLSTGIVRYQHDLVGTGKLGAMRFSRQLEKRSRFPRLQLGGDDRSLTNFQCRSDFVDLGGLPLKATFCVRAYRKFADLFDAYLDVTSLVDDTEALQSTLVLAGFSWNNLKRFSTRFLEAYRWQN
jgi:serine protease Do